MVSSTKWKMSNTRTTPAFQTHVTQRGFSRIAEPHSTCFWPMLVCHGTNTRGMHTTVYNLKKQNSSNAVLLITVSKSKKSKTANIGGWSHRQRQVLTLKEKYGNGIRYNDKHDATNSATSPSRDGESAYGVLLTPFHPRLPALEKSGRLMTGESR